MKSSASLSRNAVSNVGGLLIHLSVAFFLSPFIVRSLGNARYGAWSLVAELVGYYTLLDFGLRGAVGYYVAHYGARSERDRLGWSICSAFWTLGALGVTLTLAGIGAAFAFPSLFVKGQADSGEIILAMAIMSFTIGMSLPMEIFSAVVSGCRRLDVVNAVEIVSRLLVAAGTFLVLKAGYGLVAISLVQSGGRILTWAVLFFQARRLAGGFSLAPRNFRRTELHALAGLGSMTLAINVAQIFINRLDLVVVGLFLGVKWVAFYNIGRMLVEYASTFNFNVTRAFTPHLTHLYSGGKFAEAKRLFLLGARASGLLAMPLAACMFIYGRPFLRLWMGPLYVSGPFLERSDSVMMVLLVAHFLRWPQSISWQLVYATGKYRFLMNVTILEAVLNLALSLLLVQPFGLIGVALGTLFPMALSNLVLIPVHVLRRFEIPVLEYLREGVLRPLAVAGVLFALLSGIVAVWPPVAWRVFFLQAGLAAALEALLWLTIGMTREDRNMVASRLAPLLGRLKGALTRTA